jgi:hypothetical protein
MSKKDKETVLIPGANCACLIDENGFLVIADIDLGKDCKIKDCGKDADTVVCSYNEDSVPLSIKVCTEHAEDLMNCRLADSGVDTFYTLTKVESSTDDKDLFGRSRSINKKLLN